MCALWLSLYDQNLGPRFHPTRLQPRQVNYQHAPPPCGLALRNMVTDDIY